MEDKISIIKAVAEGASRQSQVANKLWLAVLVSIVAFYWPVHDTGPSGESLIKLPLGLGAVPELKFYPIALIVLSVLTTALAAAHAQAMRADRIAHDATDHMIYKSRDSSLSTFVHVKDLLDVLRHPSFTRVAAIPQLMTGDYHSERLRTSSGLPMDRTRSLTYVLLKIVAFAILFLVPMFGLLVVGVQMVVNVKTLEPRVVWLCYLHSLPGVVALLSLLIVAAFKWVAVLSGVVALSSLLIVAAFEWVAVWKIVLRMLNRRKQQESVLTIRFLMDRLEDYYGRVPLFKHDRDH